MIDIVIIGGGAGGYQSAIKATRLGLKAVIVEKDKLGGVCLHKGCIPTKTLTATAERLHYIQKSREFGIKVKDYSVDFPTIMKRKDEIIRWLSLGIEQLMKANQVRVIRGEGQILKSGIVEVNTAGKKEVIGTKNIIIATGSRVMKPPIPGIDLKGVITSEEALSLKELPSKIVIIGGGTIGIEFACFFKTLGVEVSVVEMLPRILSTIDEEIAQRLTRILKERGIGIFTDCKVKEIKEGSHNLEVLVSTTDGERRSKTEKVLLTVGRVPELGNLDVQKLGIGLEDSKAIKVNKKMETNIPGIYAIGDVIGGIMLAHVASREGEIAVQNIAGKEVNMDYRAVPNCVFSMPEVASVGLTEEEAKKENSNIKVSKSHFIANGKALAMGETDGLVKIIAHGDSFRLLGVHILGAHASDLIAEGTLALSMGATTREIVNTIHAHPTLAETIVEAVEGITGKPIHREGIEMDPRYKCLNCGRIWRSGEIMVVCPVCRSKPIKIKDGVDIREVVEKIKGGNSKKIARRVKNKSDK
ncbi:Dihydrolipoyl dehydrogenase [subsurface metagenome]